MICVLGGTFDPIHYGHLRPAQEAMAVLGCTVLHVIPSARPPHRPMPVASAAQRLRMVELAVAEFPGFRADDRELRREGPSYTVLTLESLRAEYGRQPLCLLLGMDAFLGFESWHHWRDILDLAHLVVLTRPGWTPDGIMAWVQERSGNKEMLSRSAAGHVFFLFVDPQDISATQMRAALAQGETVHGLLPEAVRQFICQNNIYSHQTQGI